MARHDQSLLEAALVGYQSELRRVTAAIADLQKRLGKGGRVGAQSPLARPASPKRPRISPEGRARIAEAQRKRWAAVKKDK